MILKFPKDIYLYSQQYSNHRVLSEIANFDFDYLRVFGEEVHVWFSTFDTYEFSINIPSYDGHTLTCRHRPRHVDNDNEWSFYYNKDLKDNESAFKYYHDNMSYYQKAPRDYLTNNYKPSHAIESSLIIIKSVRDILERNNIKRYTFYKPLKQKWWEEQSNNKCEWFDTGEHYEDIKNHTLGYLVKKDFWKNQNWAKAVYYD